MHIRLRLDGRYPRRWHEALIDRLAARPHHRIEVDDRPAAADALPAYVERLFRIEAAVHGLSRDGPGSRLSDTPASWPRPAGGTPTLVIDLCGDVVDAGGGRVWRLLYDGRAGEAALLDSLLAGAVPVASVVEGARTLAAARPGSELRGITLTMFDDALARTATLIAAALDGGAAPLGDAGAAPPPRAPLTAFGLARRAGRIVSRAPARRLYRLGFHSLHWRVGWRRLEGPDLAALGRHPDAGWRELPDDGRRFYADPFPIVHRGRCWLFVEEFSHATGRGVISAVAFDRAGPAGTPIRVLEAPHHLSYPFVFARDGETWMVPESCASGTIDLFRATDFPGGWVKEATLVADVVASDATLVEHDGRWWMFATVREAPAADPLGRGSYSDALYLWSAPDFRGPWTPHRANPVLIDAAAARPAGRVLLRDGAMIRPVQDCAEGYGRALRLMRVDRLDDDGFAQTPLATLASGSRWPGTRLHTLNSAGGFEFIDGSARVARFLPSAVARRP